MNRLTLLVLLVLAAAPTVATQDVDLREIAAGTWGFDVEQASCADNPHTLTFFDGGATMTLRYTVGFDGNPPTHAKYRVLDMGGDFIRMQKLNETDKSKSGELVVWDLVLLSRHSYCWHRTDWQPNGCTQPAVRCATAAN